MDFVRLAKGLTNQTSELIPTTENIYKKLNGQLNRDWYTSLFQYSQEHVDQFKKTNSVAGIRGLKTNKLLFDFDSLDLNLAKRDALEACHRLIKNGVSEDQIEVFFSGGKGFHISLNFDGYITRQEFINITFGIASDLETFDQKINDEARVIRLALSKHHKTDMYKIPLSIKELTESSVEDIKEWAKDNNFTLPNKKNTQLPEKLNVLKLKDFKKISNFLDKKEIKGFDIKDIDLADCPKWMEVSRFILSQGFFYGSEHVDKGERNTAFMILASSWKNQGFSEEHTLALLSVTAHKQALRTGEDPYTDSQLQKEIINTVFSSNWRGGIYGPDEELLILTRQRFGLSEFSKSISKNLVKIEDVGSRFKNFASNFHENRILTGIEELDEKLVITTGMCVGILGAPSSGKTSILNKIVQHQSDKNIPTVYQSLDMSDNLLYLRMLQQHSNLPVEVILEEFQKESPDPKLIEAYNNVLKSYSNVHFNFRSAMTVEQIDKDIETYKEETGLKPKFIAIDYLEKIRSDFSDPTASSGIIASQLSDLAKKHDACVVVLLQPQKSAGAPDQPLLSMRKVKGASVIEQDLRVIITVWRPGFNPQNPETDKFMSIGVVKNNLGETCQLDFAWNGMNGEISKLENRKELNNLLAEIKEKTANAYRDDI